MGKKLPPPTSGKSKTKRNAAATPSNMPSRLNSTSSESATAAAAATSVSARHPNGAGKAAGKPRRPPAGVSIEDWKRREAVRNARTALESRFVKLSPAQVEHYKTVVAKVCKLNFFLFLHNDEQVG